MMWLIGIDTSVGVGGGVRSRNVYFPDKSSPYLTLNVCSFYVGQLGFQVVSAKASALGQAESLPIASDLTVAFYPTMEPGISWPRPARLNPQHFNEFSSRWNAVKFR